MAVQLKNSMVLQGLPNNRAWFFNEVTYTWVQLLILQNIWLKLVVKNGLKYYWTLQSHALKNKFKFLAIFCLSCFYFFVFAFYRLREILCISLNLFYFYRILIITEISEKYFCKYFFIIFFVDFEINEFLLISSLTVF